MDDAVRLQVNQDYENYLLSQKKTEVYQKAVLQATENYRITKNKFDNNLVNTTDLLDANVSLLQSKINLAVAKADVVLGIQQVTGNSRHCYLHNKKIKVNKSILWNRKKTKKLPENRCRILKKAMVK